MITYVIYVFSSILQIKLLYQRKLYLSLRDKKIYKIHKIVHIGVPVKILKELAPLFLEIASHQEAFAIIN